MDYNNHPDITMRPMYHLAWSFVHGGFDPANQGGCSCEKCCILRTRITEIREMEARDLDHRRIDDMQRACGVYDYPNPDVEGT